MVDLLVVHAITLPPGCFGSKDIHALFLGQLDPTKDPFYAEIAQLKVSAHFLIDRSGIITQYVPILKRAWHAGKSQWMGKKSCNDFSIGVELEGDDKTPFEPIQYIHLALLVRALQRGLVQRGHRGFNEDCITGHQHIAPGRKWDPGSFFDWDHFRHCLVETSEILNWPLVWE